MTSVGRHAGADLFDKAGAVAAIPIHVAAGLARLAAAPLPAWPLDQAARWPALIGRVRAFASHRDGAARVCGWDDVSLYGLHQHAPYANLAAMGAAFVIAIGALMVIAIDSSAIAVVSPTGSRLRIYRRVPNPAAVVAWSG